MTDYMTYLNIARILEDISFTVSVFRFVLMKDDISNTGYLF